MLKKGKHKSIDEFLNTLDEPRKSDIRSIHELITQTVPKLAPYAEGNGIGYGKFQYRIRNGDAASFQN